MGAEIALLVLGMTREGKVREETIERDAPLVAMYLLDTSCSILHDSRHDEF